MISSAREFLAGRARQFKTISDSKYPSQVELLAGAAVACLQARGKILVFGNGGSAALATHFSGELTGRFLRGRHPLPAISLVADMSVFTGIGNDYGYGETFSRQIEAHGLEGDLALGLTTSGNSLNVVSALKRAKGIGVRSAVLSGKSGGHAAKEADLAAIVPLQDTDFIQEAHEAAIHYMCHRIDEVFCEGPGK